MWSVSAFSSRLPPPCFSGSHRTPAPRLKTSTVLSLLKPVDAIIIGFGLLLSLFNLIFSSSVHEWLVLMYINIGVSCGIIALALLRSRFTNRLIQFVHDWYPVPMIFFSFKEMYVIIQSFSGRDFDATLIAIDRWIFRVDPTVWIAQFSSPLLTEILQLSYTSFYFLMLAVGYELYVRKDEKNFSFVMFTFLYGFFLSYVGYLAVPAVGPRFTLHNFNTMNSELPGLYATNFIRDFINAGESIPANIANPIVFAQRDAFPSGHTQMTLIAMYLAATFGLKSRYIIYIFGGLLIISTVYLRYHYVVDVIGGALFMLFTVWTAPMLFHWWEKHRENRNENHYEYENKNH
jgi:membrane-associated phospholipid phosphatase